MKFQQDGWGNDRNYYCGIDVEPSKIAWPYSDEWKFAGKGKGAKSYYWRICTYAYTYPYNGISDCHKCWNDDVEGILIKRAEKGTEIYLGNNSRFTGQGDYVMIKMLRNFNVDALDLGDENKEGILIRGLESSKTDNKYYKMRYKKHDGKLDGEVSNLRVYFQHRDPTNH